MRAAQLGIVWENADHILYAFPSGMAELAERHGLALAEAAVTDERQHLSLIGDSRRCAGVCGAVTTSPWATPPAVTPSPSGAVRPPGVLHGLWWPRRRFLGETFVYVVRRKGEQRNDPAGPPRLTVIVTSYNQADLIGQALDSVAPRPSGTCS